MTVHYDFIGLHNLVNQRLTVNGDGTGSADMAADFSITPGSFYAQPPANELWWLSKLVLVLSDSIISHDKYGNITALTNGIDLLIHDGSSVSLTPEKVKTTSDWAKYATTVEPIDFDGGGSKVVRVTIQTPENVNYMLKGPQSEKIEIQLNDDLSGLLFHEARLVATKIDND